MPKVIDPHAAMDLLNLMIGTDTLPAGQESTVEVLISPRVQAHLKATLGEACPSWVSVHTIRNGKVEPLLEYLESVVESLRAAHRALATGSALVPKL